MILRDVDNDTLPPEAHNDPSGLTVNVHTAAADKFSLEEQLQHQCGDSFNSIQTIASQHMEKLKKHYKSNSCPKIGFVDYDSIFLHHEFFR
uniref:Uncharacterized protein n=1 Tax=Romanomermis culicivorax TaxID=13658 RepID=A0A915HH84_ROMCU